ncbi:MAG: glycosyltransferase family 4 protein [Candidatus Bathyarchaeia archaeon]
MRILQICPDSYANYGGISVHVRNISERLARNHDVTVYATKRTPDFPWFEIINGVKVERFKCYAPNDSYFFSLDMPLKLRKEKFDIVHAHGYHAFPLHLSTLAKCKKFVVTPHFHGSGHTIFRDSLFKLFKPFGKRVLQKADAIIAVSEFEKTLLTDYFGLAKNKISVIPNGVNFKEYEGLKKENHEFKSILYVGSLLSFKGVHYLIEVLPKLPDNIILEIVGNGPLKPFLENRARQLHVYSRVKFYENLPRKELLQKFVNSDVFVILSRYEAYSIVVAEALTAGTPCIVAKTSALTEWIDDAACFGINYPINLKELIEKINYVIFSHRKKMVGNKVFSAKIADWNQVTDRLELIYNS